MGKMVVACLVLMALMIQLRATESGAPDNRSLNSEEGVWEAPWGYPLECQNVSFYYKYADVNLSLCESIPDNCPTMMGILGTTFGRRDWCFLTLARMEENQLLCAKISDNSMKYGFVVTHRGGTSYEPGCYADVAIAKNDTALCEILPDEIFRAKCKEQIVGSAAGTTFCGLPALMLFSIIGLVFRR